MSKINILEIKKGQLGKGLLLETDGYMYIDSNENKTLKESIESFKVGNLKELPNPFIVSAVFQKFGIPNANGRVYPEAILKREVEKYQEVIKDNRGTAEANHPDGADIDISRIAIKVIELHWVGHTLVGKLIIPITEGFRRFGIVSTQADIVAHWLMSGIKLGLSSRGLGSVVQRNGYVEVDDDYSLICFDVVSSPSTPNAYIDFEEENLKPYIQENVNNDKTIIKEDKFSKFDKWLNG